MGQEHTSTQTQGGKNLLQHKDKKQIFKLQKSSDITSYKVIWARNKLFLVTKTQLPLKIHPVSAMLCVFGIIKPVFSKCENWRWQHSYKSSGFPHPMSEFCKGTGDYESLSGCGTSTSWKTGRFKRNDVCSARYFAVGESGLCKLNPALIM